MVLKRLFKKSGQRGSTEILLVVTLGLTVMVAATRWKSFNFLKMNRHNQKMEALHLRAEHLKNNVLSVITNGGAWAKTQSKNSTFQCLALKNCVHGQPSPEETFLAYDSLDRVFMDKTKTNEGFNEMGEKCTTFDGANGNDDCPFQYQNLRWYAACPDENLVTASAVCIFPKVNIKTELVYRPKSDEKKKIAFSPLRYSIDYAFYPSNPSILFTQVTEKDPPATVTRTDTDGQTAADAKATTSTKEVTQMTVEIWGAGGGGGAGGISEIGPSYSGNKVKEPTTLRVLAGGGGGGGGYIKLAFSIVGGTTTYSSTLGLGGFGGTSTQNSAGVWTHTDGKNGGDTTFTISNTKDGSSFTLTAKGGEGGERCSAWPCNNTNGNGLGGNGGKTEVKKTNGGVTSTETDVDKKNGANGSKYEAIMDAFTDNQDTTYTYKDPNYHFKKYVLNYGGAGGDSGGGQGKGGSPINNYATTANYTSPMIPGGGGAGLATQKLAEVQSATSFSAQNGADGKVVIWSAF